MMGALVGVGVACMRNGFETPAADVWQLVIVDAATKTPLTERTLSVGDTLVVSAELRGVDAEPAESAHVTWSLLGSNLPASDLQWNLPYADSATLLPSRPGAVVIVATMASPDSRVTTATAQTGVLTAVSIAMVSRLVIVSGDNQTAVVGEVLPQPLVVEVHDGTDTPIAGSSVTFSVIAGDGQLMGANPILSDVAGQASVLYRVGTMAGALNQTIHAGATSTSTASVDFRATAIAGPMSRLAFGVMPRNGYAGTPFPVQPVVVAMDDFGNRVDSTADVALEVATGTGALLGTTTVAMVAGEARFTDVGYSVAEAGVVIRATLGALSVDSEPLTAAVRPPGACDHDDTLFATFDGGCKDLQTGLIWSRRASAKYTWQEAIWDSARTVMPADASDWGRTNDYPPVSSASAITVWDWSTTAACHNLNEGGMTDWRMPTQNELLLLVAHLHAGTPPYLAGTGNETVISSSYRHGPSSDLVAGVNLVTGVGDEYFPEFHAVYCVRGDWEAPAQLAVLRAPKAIGVYSQPPNRLLCRSNKPTASK